MMVLTGGMRIRQERLQGLDLCAAVGARWTRVCDERRDRTRDAFAMTHEAAALAAV